LFCGAHRVIKKGVRGGVIRYFCKLCEKSFSSKRREKRKADKLFKDYLFNKQTKFQLQEETGASINTITRILDSCETKEKIHYPREIVAVIDATYFGRQSGVLVVRDPNKKENLHCHEITSETKEEYKKARTDLEELGYTLKAVVLDGKRGMPSVFKDILVQICQFHQWQIIRRKLTLRPKLESHQALFSIGRWISRTNRKELKRMLVVFEKKYRKELNEKTYILGTNRWRFTHAKLRSAYGSLIRNLPNLYTYQDHPELNIPNTTNSLDGFFNALKAHVNVHRGLRSDRRMKIIKGYLKRHNIQKRRPVLTLLTCS
jgi:hypothetical protein